MNAADIAPVPPEKRTQSGIDLFLIYAGANIVATTLVTGASLVPAFSTTAALVLIGTGSLLGAGLVAALAPLGPRFGAPSVILARAALGLRGAQFLAVLLYLTNFAWIALNNVIAASACARIWGGPAAERPWAVGLGLLATLVVALGPRAVGWADRLAVPVMAGVGLLLLARCLGLPPAVFTAQGDGSQSLLRGLDVVVGYQVSWILMFADYSRYTRGERRSALGVFLGLGLSSLWFMPLGLLAARAAGSSDPGALMSVLGLGASGALLLALATLNTNFVNIYLSALAFKSLRPAASERLSVWSIGALGALLSLLSRTWLDRYADFMLILGSLLVPAGGILLARFFLMRPGVDVPALYQAPAGASRDLAWRAAAAWGLGTLVYFAAAPIGGTLPALLTAVLAYALFTTKTPGTQRNSTDNATTETQRREGTVRV